MHYPSDVLAGVALGYGIGRLWPLPPEAGDEADAAEVPR
jgi:membrane-associated phospholipid phosphatase